MTPGAWNSGSSTGISSPHPPLSRKGRGSTLPLSFPRTLSPTFVIGERKSRDDAGHIHGVPSALPPSSFLPPSSVILPSHCHPERSEGSAFLLPVLMGGPGAGTNQILPFEALRGSGQAQGRRFAQNDREGRTTDKARMNPGPAAARSSVCRAPSHGASDPLPSRPDPAEARGRPSGNVALLVFAYPPGPAAAGSSVCRAPSHGASDPLPSRPGPAGAQGRPSGKVALPVFALSRPRGHRVVRALHHGNVADGRPAGRQLSRPPDVTGRH